MLPVSTGNISNEEIGAIFAANLGRLEAGFAQHAFIELGRTTLVIHV